MSAWVTVCLCVCVCSSTMVFSISPDADPPSPSHFAVCTLQLSGNCIVNARCEMANNLIWPPKLCPVALVASRRPEQHCQHRLLVVRLFRPCSSFVIDAQIKNNDKQVRQTCKDRTGNTLLKYLPLSSWLKTGTKGVNIYGTTRLKKRGPDVQRMWYKQSSTETLSTLWRPTWDTLMFVKLNISRRIYYLLILSFYLS